ncbi:hypothetical protein NDU88_004579, partial [Pleurodeles waltl]
NGSRGLATKASTGQDTGGTSETTIRQSPERTEIGRVEIQADGTTALATPGQQGDVEAPSSIREQKAIHEESGADDDIS